MTLLCFVAYMSGNLRSLGQVSGSISKPGVLAGCQAVVGPG